MSEVPSVIGFHLLPNGFRLLFDQPVPTILRLYDGGAGHVLQPPVLWIGVTADNSDWSVAVTCGSLVWNADRTEVTYIYTYGLWPDDTYTLRLTCPDVASYECVFVTQFRATSAGLSVESFARGPGQEVDLIVAGSAPADPTFHGGIPIRLTRGNGATKVLFNLRYDVAMLVITGATVHADAPAGATFERVSHHVQGEIATDVFAFRTWGELLDSPEAMILGTLQASIPNRDGQAIYRASQLLELLVIESDGQLPTVPMHGVEVVCFLGDVDGDSRYTTADARLIIRVSGGTDRGFAVFPEIDPVLLADILAQGGVDILNAQLVFQKSGCEVRSIPDVPAMAQC